MPTVPQRKRSAIEIKYSVIKKPVYDVPEDKKGMGKVRSVII